MVDRALTLIMADSAASAEAQRADGRGGGARGVGRESSFGIYCAGGWTERPTMPRWPLWPLRWNPDRAEASLLCCLLEGVAGARVSLAIANPPGQGMKTR